MENVRSSLLLVVRHVAHDRFNLLSVASIKHSLDIMLKYIESDSTLSDMQEIKENLIMYSIDRQRVKCGKYSFAHHGGPISIANVRSRLRAVPEMWEMFVLAYYWLPDYRFNLLLVASIKHSVDIMLKYIESDSTLSDMQLNKRKLDYIQY